MELPQDQEHVIGIDEVGRGSLAGPLVIAAVFGDGASLREIGVKDSKKLSAGKRDIMSSCILAKYKYAIIVIEPSVIDKINILNAVKFGMNSLISDMKQATDAAVYVDGNQNPCPYATHDIHALVGGDSLIPAVSAASIIAKEARDALMLELAEHHPEYSWHKNVGYGTKEHLRALKEYGMTVHHRRSFCKRLAT